MLQRTARTMQAMTAANNNTILIVPANAGLPRRIDNPFPAAKNSYVYCGTNGANNVRTILADLVAIAGC
ncbi:hypothetical protein FRC12_007298 [Ceratobasidium sp. 428]|nr:hypothetical protein FRC12_007298 [Ceratobasidium sp. 428]